MILKCPRFVPLGANLIKFGANPDDIPDWRCVILGLLFTHLIYDVQAKLDDTRYIYIYIFNCLSYLCTCSHASKIRRSLYSYMQVFYSIKSGY